MSGTRCDLEALSQGSYLWDNWIAYDPAARRYHRYLLAAPRSLSPEERHAGARIRHAVSDSGAGWRDLGDALGPGPAGAFDDLATWTGTTVVDGGRFYLFYTGVSQRPGLPQTIALATSRDGHAFEKRREPVLPPSAQLGYDLGDGDGVVMAWRDAHVALDPASGQWHMVFGCKRDGERPRGAVGHAVARGGDLTRWELRPPLALPARFRQAEVPALLFAGGAVYCAVSTKDAERDGARASGSAWRLFKAPAMEGPGEAATREPLISPSDRVYGARPFIGPDALGVVAFYAPDHPRGLSPTRIAELSLEPYPRLDRAAWR